MITLSDRQTDGLTDCNVVNDGLNVRTKKTKKQRKKEKKKKIRRKERK